MDLFEKERHQLQTLLNQKTVLYNIFYRIKHDKNITFFLGDLFNQCSNFDNLDRMGKINFKSFSKEIHSFLEQFFLVAAHHSKGKGKTAEEVATNKFIFSDSKGKDMLTLFGYLPLLHMVYDKIQYEELSESEISDDEVSALSIGQKERNKFNDFYDFACIDFKYKNKLVKNAKHSLFVEYIQNNERIKKFCNSFFESENKDDFLFSIGSTYWDAYQENEQSKRKVIEDILATLAHQKTKQEEMT